MDARPTRVDDDVAKPRRRGPARTRTATILLVEDDAMVREATTLWLESGGYRVLAAATDDQALWLWKRHAAEIDLLITDLMIPTRCTGIDLARQFLAARPGLPVILTSGFGRDIGDGDPDFPGQLPFLQKPFAPEELQTLVAEMIGRT